MTKPICATDEYATRSFNIRLNHCDKCAVNNADNCQNNKQPSEFARRFGKQYEIKTHQAVSSHFQQHGGENNRTRRRCFGVRVGQPGVKREKRNFDRKRQRERAEKQQSVFPLKKQAFRL